MVRCPSRLTGTRALAATIRCGGGRSRLRKEARANRLCRRAPLGGYPDECIWGTLNQVRRIPRFGCGAPLLFFYARAARWNDLAAVLVLRQPFWVGAEPGRALLEPFVLGTSIAGGCRGPKLTAAALCGRSVLSSPDPKGLARHTRWSTGRMFFIGFRR